MCLQFEGDDDREAVEQRDPVGNRDESAESRPPVQGVRDTRLASRDEFLRWINRHFHNILDSLGPNERAKLLHGLNIDYALWDPEIGSYKYRGGKL